MKKITWTVAFACATFATDCLMAQQKNDLIKGHLSGSFENTTQFYKPDTAIKTELPPGADRYGSNSYLKLDYNYGKFSAGIQYESYLPSLLKFFPVPFDPQSKLVNKYFKFTDDKFSIQVGDFYEQFGSGLIFRSYENRQIGINNSMEGANVFVQPLEFMKVKVIYGRMRKLFDFSKSDFGNNYHLIRGGDLELDINQLLKKNDSKVTASVGGSYINKYQEYVGPLPEFPSAVNAYAGRFEIGNADFSIDAEYVLKTSDPEKLNNQLFTKGKGFLLNGCFTKGHLGVTATYRTMYNMYFQCNRDEEFITLAPVNFVPALTKQHDYLTSNIYVYAAQPNGESGGQLDIYYDFSAGTKLGGKHGMKLSANFSTYSGLVDSNKIFSSAEEYFHDANIELKKKWNKKIEMTIGLQQIFRDSKVSPTGGGDLTANIVALGVLYKWKPKKSVRVKFEHLSTEEDQKNWMSALTEFSFSSPYQFFISDLYNYGQSKVHYYNFGASVTRKATRFALAYGKQRAGLFCAGGVCRFVPATYGLTATLTTSFAN